MAEVTRDPAVGDTSEKRRAEGRSYYLLWSLVAALSIVAFPVMTLVWCRLALRIPETLYEVKPELGPFYSQIGAPGVGIVTASMASVMAAFWLLGDRRILWRVRIPVILVVLAAHVLVVIWLSGRSIA
jgi:hypothetical protein